jgi:MoaA/NifB/PqqE/SkfB family radical SAM enzyme
MEFLGKCAFPVSLTTTSERFAEPAFLCDVLAVFPARRLSVTTALHSFDPAVHDAMTRTPGSFHRWLGGLLALEAAGVSTTLKHLLSRPTIDALPRFVETYYQKFAQSTGLYLCAMDFSGSAALNREKVYLPFAEIRKWLEPALDLARERRAAGDARQVWVLDLPLCAVGEEYHGFFPDGRRQANVPVFYDAPDHESVLFSDSLTPQWSVPGDICAPCRLKDRCRGTWSSATGRHDASDYRPFIGGSANA